ncbi:SDR family oxidoreductase [bacterium AH-315-F18]|nr:SDR family oxidoreductase [bacterium AH-315-F18]
MSISIQDSVAFVTGANRGIGRALVEALIAKGAKKVYAGARKLDSLKSLIDAHAGKVVAIELDITKPEQVTAAAASAQDTTLLFNNAGVAGLNTSPGIDILDGRSAEIAHHEIGVNFFGTLSVSQAFAPILGQNGGGGLANVISVAGFVNFPLFPTYSVSKAALHSLTQSLRLSLKSQGTHVTGIYPGPIDTDMAKDVPFEKISAAQAANSILAAWEAGEEYILPDPMAAGMGKTYFEQPLGLERQMEDMAAANA